MAWKHNGREIRVGRSWVSDDGFKHPANWLVWTAEEKEAFKVVWEDDPVVAVKVVPLDTQKANAIKSIKRTAASKLAETDWYVIKATEVDGYTVPSDITTYRAAVRTSSNTIEAKINNASDQDAFNALYEVPENGNAPINDWPDEV